MSVNTKDLHAGRRRMKAVSAICKRRARELLAEEKETGKTPLELENARSIMAFHHGLRAKNLDAVIVAKKPLLGAEVLLIFDGVLRGVPNVLAAPTRPRSETDIDAEVTRMVTAAWIRIIETTGQILSDTKQDIRMFKLQDVFLQVPGDFVDRSGRIIPVTTGQQERQLIRKTEIEKLKQLIGHGTFTTDRFDAASEDTQVALMVAASRLLCVEINQVV